MIAIPTAPWAHYIGDAAAWAIASAAAWGQHRRWPAQSQRLARITGPGYYLAMSLCAVVGAWLVGSMNSLPVSLSPSHSVAGALAGGIIGVELWKWRHGVRQSTGGAFVLPLAVGIAVGRLGCLFSGPADLTYGTPSALPWAVDLGDGVGRHPVQLYEALGMALFVAVFLAARLRSAGWAMRQGFHVFVVCYAAQRFAWEFLKPYPKVAGPFNVFHLLCVGMIGYGLWWLRHGAGSGAGDTGAQGGALRVPQPDDEPVRDVP